MAVNCAVCGSMLLSAARTQATARATVAVARQQAFVLLADMDQDRARFEQAKVTFAVDRHLIERLLAAILGRTIIRTTDQADAIG